MSVENPYQAPQSTLEISTEVPRVSTEAEPGLATRWSRLGAAMLDGAIQVAVLLPLLWSSGYLKNESKTLGSEFFWSVLAFLTYVVINVWTLRKNGQTIGKLVFGIRVTDLNGQLMPVTRLIFVRTFPFWIAAQIPLVGGWISPLECLLIFNADRRCGHDHLAGSQVEKAGSPPANHF